MLRFIAHQSSCLPACLSLSLYVSLSLYLFLSRLSPHSSSLSLCLPVRLAVWQFKYLQLPPNNSWCLALIKLSANVCHAYRLPPPASAHLHLKLLFAVRLRWASFQLEFSNAKWKKEKETKRKQFSLLQTWRLYIPIMISCSANCQFRFLLKYSYDIRTIVWRITSSASSRAAWLIFLSAAN